MLSSSSRFFFFLNSQCGYTGEGNNKKKGNPATPEQVVRFHSKEKHCKEYKKQKGKENEEKKKVLRIKNLREWNWFLFNAPCGARSELGI